MALKKGPLSEAASIYAEYHMRTGFAHLDTMVSWATHVIEEADGDAQFGNLVVHLEKFKDWFGDTNGHGKANVPWDHS